MILLAPELRYANKVHKVLLMEAGLAVAESETNGLTNLYAQMLKEYLQLLDNNQSPS